MGEIAGVLLLNFVVKIVVAQLAVMAVVVRTYAVVSCDLGQTWALVDHTALDKCLPEGLVCAAASFVALVQAFAVVVQH